MVPTLQAHIVSDLGVAGGKPRLVGHRMTVANVVVWHEMLGLAADEIATLYGLSLAEVYAALSFYFQNPAEINLSLAESEDFIRQLREETPSKISGH